MKRNEQDRIDQNGALDPVSSFAIVNQLAGQPDEPAETNKRRRESHDGSWQFDIPGAARGIMTVLPDSPGAGSDSTASLPIDLDTPDDGLAAASEMLGGGLIAGSESLGGGLGLASEEFGDGLNTTFEVFGDGLVAFGEALGGLFDALGDLDFDLFCLLDFDCF